jgi:hypothetical protein
MTKCVPRADAILAADPVALRPVKSVLASHIDVGRRLKAAARSERIADKAETLRKTPLRQTLGLAFLPQRDNRSVTRSRLS